MSTQEREKLIQTGRHYSEMLPIEYIPSSQYMTVYNQVLELYSDEVANAIGNLSDKIITQKGKNIVLQEQAHLLEYS